MSGLSRVTSIGCALRETFKAFLYQLVSSTVQYSGYKLRQDLSIAWYLGYLESG